MRFVFSAMLLVGPIVSGPISIASAFDPAQQDDSLALVRHFQTPPDPVGPPLKEGAFVPLKGETISLMGGSDVFRMQEFPYLEARFQVAFPDHHLHFRNLGWSADTVYRQQRPMFFHMETGDTREGSVPDLRQKVKPGTLILSFGKMESLEGITRLPEFEKAYRQLLDKLGQLSARIVLIAPVPFAEVGPAASLAKDRNDVLAQYSGRIASLAKDRNLIFVPMEVFPNEGFLRTGLHLNETGLREWSEQVGKALGMEETKAELGPVLKATQSKNHLWDQYYRPTNWAFLFGDRQHVPSSRDHENSDRRWFVEEIEMMPSLMLEKESEIWSLAKGGQR